MDYGSLANIVSSPHAWGCFQKGVTVAQLKEVFPTRVGVFLGPEA